jgi:hypothetical protein
MDIDVASSHKSTTWVRRKRFLHLQIHCLSSTQIGYSRAIQSLLVNLTYLQIPMFAFMTFLPSLS